MNAWDKRKGKLIVKLLFFQKLNNIQIWRPGLPKILAKEKLTEEQLDEIWREFRATESKVIIEDVK